MLWQQGEEKMPATLPLCCHSARAAWSPLLAPLPEVARSRGEEFAPDQEHESFQQISLPVDPGKLKCWG